MTATRQKDRPNGRPRDVTSMLVAWRQGNEEALEQLMPVVYQELRRLANRYMQRERADHTLSATALVHEAYLRLIDQRQVDWQNRAHFFAIAAQMMRRILVTHARERHAGKRGGSERKISLDEVLALSAARDEDLVALDEALTRLGAMDPPQSRIVELRYFGGLSIEETAAVLGISPSKVKYEWSVARAWLHRELKK